VTPAERRAAREAIAAEVRDCTRCRLSETRTRAVPGEGDPNTEVLLVGEGPGMNEDREGRPFIGRAGALLERLLGHIGWQRDDVFITNVVKCRPPGNRDPEPDEMAACAPYLRRQAAVLDPSVVVTLGRFSMATFMPGVRISQAHGTTRLADPATGARDATVFAMYHPAYALRNPAVERESFDDVARIPGVLVAARERRALNAVAVRAVEPASVASAALPMSAPTAVPSPPGRHASPQPPTTPSSASQAPADDADQLTIF
jgi:uracil-DNA glycosylase family 4